MFALYQASSKKQGILIILEKIYEEEVPISGLSSSASEF